MTAKTAIEEIKKRLLLSSVVGEVVKLSGRAPNFLALCPFHEEKTPSFHVRDAIGKFKCFGCQLSGDAIDFVMRLRGLSLQDALQELSEKAGLRSLDHKKAVQKSAPSQKQDELLQAQALAQKFFVTSLHEAEGAPLKDYLIKERGLSEAMIRQAGIGFGGKASERFSFYCRSVALSERVLLEAGLLRRMRFGLEPSFLGRLTIPIRDMSGKIIAFGGRAHPAYLPADVAKYVNTHAYKHFEKRKTFYGLFESKEAIVKGKSPVLVEGYFDAMALWAAGSPALSLCGTSLSSEHVKLLKRLSSRVTLALDQDEAGLRALQACVMECAKENMQPFVVNLKKKDPGEYLAARDLPALKAELEEKENALSYVIERVALKAHESISARVDCIESLMPLFQAIKNPLMRQQYVAYFSKQIHEDSSILWRELEKRKKPEALESQKKALPITFSKNEQLLYQILLCHPSLKAEVAEEIWQTVNPKLKSSLENLFEKKLTLGKRQLNSLPKLSEEEAKLLLAAMGTDLEKKSRKSKLEGIRRALFEAEKNKNPQEIMRLMKEHRALIMDEKKLAASPLGHELVVEKNVISDKISTNKLLDRDFSHVIDAEEWI
jgi:DNA primase